MKSISSYLNSLRNYSRDCLSNIYQKFNLLEASKRIDIPYFSQFESSNLVDKIIGREVRSKVDPKWRDSGAKSKEEYEYWSWNLCGVTCLKMILLHKLEKEFKTIELTKRSIPYGAYKVNKQLHEINTSSTSNNEITQEMSNAIDGLFYKPFCDFLLSEFSLKAQPSPQLSVNRIKYEIHKNNYIIVSVHPDIRRVTNDEPIKKGGHLILMTGYNHKDSTLTLHNPSGYYSESQENVEISITDFNKFYAGRGIIIYNN